MYSKISFVSLVVLGVYLTFTPSGVLGNLMCYSCASTGSNSSCADPVTNSTNMATCGLSSDKCTKITFEIANQTVWNRLCSSATCDQLKESFAPANAIGLTNFQCTQCTTDHCNGAGSFGVSLVGVAVALIAFKLF